MRAAKSRPTFPPHGCGILRLNRASLAVVDQALPAEILGGIVLFHALCGIL